MDNTAQAAPETPPEPGHNMPPVDAHPLRDRLNEQYGDQIKRRDALLDAFNRVPEEIEDEETAGRVADFIKQVNTFVKRANTIHKEEKDPHLRAGQIVDNFWHHLIDDIKDAKAKADAVRKRYADRKAAAERAKREEEERQAREAAEKARLEAEERERKLQAELAEARREKEEAEAAAAEERRKREEEAEKHRQMRMRGVETEEELDALIAEEEAEKHRQAEEEAARRRQSLADQEEANRRERESIREARKAQEEADRAEKAAIKAGKRAGAKPAELGRSRGEYGGITTLREKWLHTDLSRADIDLEALRQHLDKDDIEKAIRRWIDANTEALSRGEAELAGVRIYRDTTL